MHYFNFSLLLAKSKVLFSIEGLKQKLRQSALSLCWYLGAC